MTALKQALGEFQRINLLEGPTPLQRLGRLEESLDNPQNARIYAKRDDLMGLGGGGNKLRKLEFLLGEAIATGGDTVITTGGMQSNHARLAAAAAAKLGLTCELVLRRSFTRNDEAFLNNGNILLDNIFGATVYELDANADAAAYMEQRAAKLRSLGRHPFVCAAGGSSPVGCLGYAACALEISEQEDSLGERFECIVLPNGGSGTHAGLAAGFHRLSLDPSRIRSYAVLADAEISRQKTWSLATATAALLRAEGTLEMHDVRVLGEQRGPGYGVPTPAMFEAVQLLARTEGLLVDPVYGGKALAGMIKSVRSGDYAKMSAVLFLMTGGGPGIFAYEPAFRSFLLPPM